MPRVLRSSSDVGTPGERSVLPIQYVEGIVAVLLLFGIRQRQEAAGVAPREALRTARRTVPSKPLIFYPNIQRARISPREQEQEHARWQADRRKDHRNLGHAAGESERHGDKEHEQSDCGPADRPADR